MWYTATSASVTTGATVVAVTTGDDISIIQEDSGLIFEGESPVQVKRGYIDGFGDKFIELASPWPYTDKVAQPIVAYPTDASFAEATAELRRVIDTLEVASTVDMQAATNDTKIATPLKVKQAIDFNTGTAATRDVGESTGNLMEVGAFGLGLDEGLLLPANNADVLNRTGIYRTPATWVGSAYTGTNANNQGSLYHAKAFTSGSSYATQIFLSMSIEKTMFFRRNDGTAWSEWIQLYHTGNIVGTVSQSGGVPTGAIIESGSNVNGEYVKYADGTMICTVDSLTITANSNTTISFPSTFFSATRCIITGDLAAATNNYIFGSNTAQGSVSIRAVGIAGSVTLGYIAIGRWY